MILLQRLQNHYYSATTFCYFSAAFILLGVIIYGAKGTSLQTENLHFSFAFVIIAAIIAIVASVLFGIDK